MFSHFNENWYLGLFWSEKLVGIDEICIQGHFYEATIFKMAANKIVKLSMVSDFNENWYLWVVWSKELVGVVNSDMGVVWDFCVCIQTQSNLVIIIVRPNFQRLMIRSLLSFTGRSMPISRGASSLGIFKMAAVAMETVNLCQNLWPHLYQKLQRDFHKTWHIY